MISDNLKYKASYLLSILSCFTLISSITIYYIDKQRKVILKNHKYNTIPSPPNRLPLLGHLLHLVNKVPSKQISLWHKELGPLFQIQMGQQTWIMISDPSFAHEIFVNQGNRSSGRPFHNFCVKIYGRDNRGIVFSDYSSKWKCHRKAAIAVLGPKSVDRFSEILEFEADLFIERLRESKSKYINPYEDLQLNSLNIITTTCLGVRFDSTEDKTFRKINHFVQGSMVYAGVAGDIGTFLPGLGWLNMIKRKEMKKFVKEWRDAVYEKLVQNSLEGNADCLVKTIYEVKDKLELDSDDILVFMSDFIGAGADTVAITLYWTFAILSQQIDVQEKLIKELDDWKINNQGKLPEYNKHRGDFPYMISVQKEIMRFRPTTNFGIPHTATEDIVIQNYVIPKGATLITSMADIHRNPKYYTNPDVFDPDRFMYKTERMTVSAHARISERDHFAFGWGRRICPGIHLTEVELFNIYVRLFSAFTIRPQLDEFGKPIHIDLNDYEDSGIVAKPTPFKVHLIPRKQINNEF